MNILDTTLKHSKSFKLLNYIEKSKIDQTSYLTKVTFLQEVESGRVRFNSNHGQNLFDSCFKKDFTSQSIGFEFCRAFRSLVVRSLLLMSAAESCLLLPEQNHHNSLKATAAAASAKLNHKGRIFNKNFNFQFQLHNGHIKSNDEFKQ